jgi:hypothetical protein
MDLQKQNIGTIYTKISEIVQSEAKKGIHNLKISVFDSIL